MQVPPPVNVHWRTSLAAAGHVPPLGTNQQVPLVLTPEQDERSFTHLFAGAAHGIENAAQAIAVVVHAPVLATVAPDAHA